MKTLVCKKYGAVVIEDAVKLKLLPDTKIKPFK